MRIPRVFADLPLAPGETIPLPASAARHVGKVLRLRPGDSLRVFNGAGLEFAATLGGDQRSMTADLSIAIEDNTESPLDTTLVQGICRGERMDYCIQKATELGITSICPVLATRSVVKLDDSRAKKRLAHWRGVAISAAEQSGRRLVPAVDEPVSLADYLAQTGLPTLRLLNFDGAGAADWSLDPAQPVALLAGPEGGWTPEEAETAKSAGAMTWRLGPRILRTETAGLAALAVIQSRWGDW